MVRCVGGGGGVAATGGWDNCVKVWDCGKDFKYRRTLQGHTDRIEGIAVDPSGGKGSTRSLSPC